MSVRVSWPAGRKTLTLALCRNAGEGTKRGPVFGCRNAATSP